MIRRPPRSTQSRSSAASDVYKRQESKECYELFKDIEKEQGLEPTHCKSVQKTMVGGVFNKIGRKMLFLFDYGDEWHFIVELKGLESPKQDIKYPLILESRGNVPPQYG